MCFVTYVPWLHRKADRFLLRIVFCQTIRSINPWALCLANHEHVTICSKTATAPTHPVNHHLPGSLWGRTQQERFLHTLDFAIKTRRGRTNWPELDPPIPKQILNLISRKLTSVIGLKSLDWKWLWWVVLAEMYIRSRFLPERRPSTIACGGPKSRSTADSSLKQPGDSHGADLQEPDIR